MTRTKTPIAELEHRLLLSVREVAALTGISHTTIYALIAAGELAAVQLDRVVRVRRADLDTLLAERSVTQAPPAPAPSPVAARVAARPEPFRINEAALPRRRRAT